jgi:hypothetical protein
MAISFLNDQSISGTLTVTDNIGIGISVPATKLYVVDANNDCEVTIQSQVAGDVAGNVLYSMERKWKVGLSYGSTPGNYYIYDDFASASRLEIDFTGNIGLGTVPVANRKLKVDGNSLVDGTMYVSGNSNTYSIEVGQSRTTAGTAFLDLTGEITPDDYGLRMIRYGGLNALSKIVHTGTNNLEIEAENGGDILLSNANVGIGKQPTTKLDVNGIITATGGVFTGQVTIPVIPVATTDAASKAYVDAQTASGGAIAGTGTVLSLTTTSGAYYNMSSASSATTYTTSGTVLGATAYTLINTTSRPTVTGADMIKGDDWEPNVDMHLGVQYFGVVVQSFFKSLLSNSLVWNTNATQWEQESMVW